MRDHGGDPAKLLAFPQDPTAEPRSLRGVSARSD